MPTSEGFWGLYLFGGSICVLFSMISSSHSSVSPILKIVFLITAIIGLLLLSDEITKQRISSYFINKSN